jgi:hypothetical protein
MTTGYRLLDAFEQTFRGAKYRHRNSTLGDAIAVHLYEDLLNLELSSNLAENIRRQELVVNIGNTRRGVSARRGDGTFGVKVPATPATMVEGFSVARGNVATIEVGIEVKILFKAMIKQIDRVCSDLRGQVAHFRRGGANPISVGVVGINHASSCTSYERERAFPTDGGEYKHPIQEAGDAAERLRRDAERDFDFFLILPFVATNVEPFPFDWVNQASASADYGSRLVRIARDFDHRFQAVRR